jgi:hypothetical protein
MATPVEPWWGLAQELVTFTVSVYSFVASIKRWRERKIALTVAGCAILLMGLFPPEHGHPLWMLLDFQLPVLGWLRGRRANLGTRTTQSF